MENINIDEYYGGKILVYLTSIRNRKEKGLIIDNITYEKYNNHIAIIIELTNPNNKNSNKYCLFVLDRNIKNDILSDNILPLSTSQTREFINQLRNYSICPLPGLFFIYLPIYTINQCINLTNYLLIYTSNLYESGSLVVEHDNRIIGVHFLYSKNDDNSLNCQNCHLLIIEDSGACYLWNYTKSYSEYPYIWLLMVEFSLFTPLKTSIDTSLFNSNSYINHNNKIKSTAVDNASCRLIWVEIDEVNRKDIVKCCRLDLTLYNNDNKIDNKLDKCTVTSNSIILFQHNIDSIIIHSTFKGFWIISSNGCNNNNNDNSNNNNIVVRYFDCVTGRIFLYTLSNPLSNPQSNPLCDSYYNQSNNTSSIYIMYNSKELYMISKEVNSNSLILKEIYRISDRDLDRHRDKFIDLSLHMCSKIGLILHLLTSNCCFSYAVSASLPATSRNLINYNIENKEKYGKNDNYYYKKIIELIYIKENILDSDNNQAVDRDIDVNQSFKLWKSYNGYDIDNSRESDIKIGVYSKFSLKLLLVSDVDVYITTNNELKSNRSSKNNTNTNTNTKTNNLSNPYAASILSRLHLRNYSKSIDDVDNYSNNHGCIDKDIDRDNWISNIDLITLKSPLNQVNRDRSIDRDVDISIRNIDLDVEDMQMDSFDLMYIMSSLNTTSEIIKNNNNNSNNFNSTRFIKNMSIDVTSYIKQFLDNYRDSDLNMVDNREFKLYQIIINLYKFQLNNSMRGNNNNNGKDFSNFQSNTNIINQCIQILIKYRTFLKEINQLNKNLIISNIENTVIKLLLYVNNPILASELLSKWNRTRILYLLSLRVSLSYSYLYGRAVRSSTNINKNDIELHENNLNQNKYNLENSELDYSFSYKRKLQAIGIYNIALSICLKNNEIMFINLLKNNCPTNY